MTENTDTVTQMKTLAEIDALNIKFNLHEYHCEKNREEILSSGATILFLAGILFTLII